MAVGIDAIEAWVKALAAIMRQELANLLSSHGHPADAESIARRFLS
jgi:hypothetical protein